MRQTKHREKNKSTNCSIFLADLRFSCKLLTSVSLLKNSNLHFKEAGKGVVASPSQEFQQMWRQRGEHKVSQEGFGSDGRMKVAREGTFSLRGERKSAFNVTVQHYGRGNLPSKVPKLQMEFLSSFVIECVFPHYRETFLGSGSRWCKHGHHC